LGIKKADLTQLKGIHMNLTLDFSTGDNLSSSSQKVRRITENWMEKNMYCPRCGKPELLHFQNNRPVADFYCSECHSEYELKSYGGALNHKVVDGAYNTMIQRITSDKNPDFFFMGYNHQTGDICNLHLVPKHFFVSAIIEKRKPLAVTARRAGWVGCNILVENIPEQGRISIVKNNISEDKSIVMARLKQADLLKIRNLDSRSWLIDMLNCINHIPNDVFTLNEVYASEVEMRLLHPENYHIKDKMRQLLQQLRDRHIIEFFARGVYRKVRVI
jgi:type II restriction enzyme